MLALYARPWCGFNVGDATACAARRWSSANQNILRCASASSGSGGSPRLCGAPINGAASSALQVLCHMWRNPHISALAHKFRIIKSLVAPSVTRPGSRNLLEHGHRRQALGCARGFPHHARNDQSVAILHQQVSAIAEFCLLAWTCAPAARQDRLLIRASDSSASRHENSLRDFPDRPAVANSRACSTTRARKSLATSPAVRAATVPAKSTGVPPSRTPW